MEASNYAFKIENHLFSASSISFVNISRKPSRLTVLLSELTVFWDIWIIVAMIYTVMSDEILKEFDSKIYCAVTKIRNDRKRAEIDTIH